MVILETNCSKLKCTCYYSISCVFTLGHGGHFGSNSKRRVFSPYPLTKPRSWWISNKTWEGQCFIAHLVVGVAMNWNPCIWFLWYYLSSIHINNLVNIGWQLKKVHILKANCTPQKAFKLHCFKGWWNWSKKFERLMRPKAHHNSDNAY